MRLPVLPSTAPLNPLADELQKVTAHEDAAHQKRNWVRLSYDCNNRCTFCLDSHAHNGTMRDDREIRVQIIEGRRKGAERLILSGGEPTMHPRFLDYIALGRRAGYPWIQTVTNGRMFSYPEFLNAALRNGLNEITFSLHGHTPKLHDALVGTPGAFAQEVAGLKAALATGQVVISVDVVINKMNVRHLPEMLETFLEWGVREFDLLQVIPFGNAWTDARDHLFYDLEDPTIVASIRRALELAKRPDVHIWLNRFPPPHAEGFEELIQDPYKLNDEVRGRREEYDRYLSIGQKLMCRQPERCQYCYLQGLCDTLDEVIDARKAPHVDEIHVPHVLPTLGTLPSARLASVEARHLAAAAPLLDRLSAQEVRLHLDDYRGLADALEGDRLRGKRLVQAVAANPAQMNELLSLEVPFEVVVLLTQDTAPAILALPEIPPRLVLHQPNYELVTEARASDIDLRAFFRSLPRPVPVENVAPCLTLESPSRELSPRPTVLDTATLADDGRIHMASYTKRYILQNFYTKSLRCKECIYTSTCRGMHITWVRAHGYAPLEPIRG
ncbi:MAG: radical SAM protein [Polyangiaceae bacterium]|nr:radical SAM protein [Polyangiaceae bacterium]